MRKELFRDSISQLTEYYNKNPQAEEIGVIWGIVKDLSDEDFMELVKKILVNLRYWPRFSEWLDFMGRDDDIEIKAAKIVRGVEDVVEKYGAYATMIFPSFVADAIEDMGGWEAICLCSVDEWLRFRRRDFKKAILLRLKSGQGSAGMGETRLPGLAERAGWHGDYAVQPTLSNVTESLKSLKTGEEGEKK